MVGKAQNIETLEPLVDVIDQKVINNSVVIPKITSPGPGFIVIHNDSGGRFSSETVGHSAVNHGINVAIVVNLSGPSTAIVYAMLHFDNQTGGQRGIYDGFRTDGAVRDINNNVISPPFTLLDEIQPQVVVSDQPIIRDIITVDLITLDTSNGWIVIHADNYGAPGIILGESPVIMGRNFNIPVEIQKEYRTAILHAMLHIDNTSVGEILSFDWPNGPDGPIRVDGIIVSPTFDVSGFSTTIISNDEQTSSLITDSKSLHIIFSFLSGIFLIVIGLMNLSRNFKNRLNQVFLGFYAGIGNFQIFDALLVFSDVGVSLQVNNLLRDISIASLIIGLGFGVLGVLIIQYGEDFIFQKNIVFTSLITIMILLIVSLLGDDIGISTNSGGTYGDAGAGAHTATFRNEYGWLGITSSFVLFSGIIIYSLFTLLRKAERDLKIKLLRILIGFTLAISMLFLFDIAFVFEFVQKGFMGDFFIHILGHLGVVIGNLLILSAYWTPLKN
ncbi:MAG: DUF7282 domain-containing protein [Candidatus Hodarchaeales archaeon]